MVLRHIKRVLKRLSERRMTPMVPIPHSVVVEMLPQATYISFSVDTLQPTTEGPTLEQE